MEHGSKKGDLSINDFPNGHINPEKLPTIELETVVFEKTAPGEMWIRTDPVTGEMFVRERWTWKAPGQPEKVGWDVEQNRWHDSKGPWGTPQVAQVYRPRPHRITAFHSPSDQANEVTNLLKEALKKRVKEISKAKADDSTQNPSEYEKLLESIKTLQKTIATDAANAVESVKTELEKTMSHVFPGFVVTFDARPEDDLEKTITFFKADPLLKIGPKDGHLTTLDLQGSGTSRTLMWAALRILADLGDGKTESQSARPNLLLIDEPELCLHPDAIREACKVLYDLPRSKNWQVMITTHSPVFIDLSRDNTSIVRVERVEGSVHGTTIFRPNKARLDEDDRKELKLLNICDPYVAEFFFGGKTILVEGDTEYTAFKHVMSQDPSKYKNLHIVRARGKSCLVSLCKILNQFGKDYVVLHDSDNETIIGKKTKRRRANPAWSENEKIKEVVSDSRSTGASRVIASVPNFEEAFFFEKTDGDKPYSALARLKQDDTAFTRIGQLLDALSDSANPLPDGAVEWSDLDELRAALSALQLEPETVV
jgi:putative ATP-dependent endonuclease of OLD family